MFCANGKQRRKTTAASSGNFCIYLYLHISHIIRYAPHFSGLRNNSKNNKKRLPKLFIARSFRSLTHSLQSLPILIFCSFLSLSLASFDSLSNSTISIYLSLAILFGLGFHFFIVFIQFDSYCNQFSKREIRFASSMLQNKKTNRNYYNFC